MSVTPCAKKYRASAKVETVMGTFSSPARTRRTSIDLDVFTCGRRVTPRARTFARIRAAFRSSRGKSRMSEGVGRSLMVRGAEVARSGFVMDTDLVGKG